jgi:hypothetical protein
MIDKATLLARLSSNGAASAALQLAPLTWSRSGRPYVGDLAFADSDRPYAIVTTVTDNFIGVGSVFLLSLQEQLANRDKVDVILAQSEEIAPLSQENRDLLSRLCPGLRILDIDTTAFLDDANMTRYDADGKAIGVRLDARVLPSKRAAYVKLNVMRLTQYDKVVLMDSDLMVVNDFSELFEVEADMAAVPSGRFDGSFPRTEVPRWAYRGGFNSGVLLLSRRCRGERPFNAALDFMDQKKDRKLRDQSVLNHVLRRAGKELLPHVYNHKLHKADPDMLGDRGALETSKIIHFVGRSKWQLKDHREAGGAIYDRFHEIQARTGAPFVLEG